MGYNETISLMLEENLDCGVLFKFSDDFAVCEREKIERSIPSDIFPWQTDMHIHTNVAYICKIEMMGFAENVPFFNLLVHQTFVRRKQVEKENGKERELKQ